METGNVRFDAMKSSRAQVARISHADTNMLIAGAALTFVTTIAFVHPHPLVLPLLSILLVTASMAIAGIVAWRHRRDTGSLLDRMHLAGLVIFFGFAAAMLGDPDAALKSISAVR